MVGERDQIDQAVVARPFSQVGFVGDVITVLV
jgi:hypothetical protein